MPNTALGAPQAEPAAAEPAEEEPAKLPPLDVRAGHTSLTDDQVRIVKQLKAGPLQVDDLIEAVDLPARRVLSALTVLEMYVGERSWRA